jgi:hypothetical protein
VARPGTAGQARSPSLAQAARTPAPCRGNAWVGSITTLDIWSGIYDLSKLAWVAQFKGASASAAHNTNRIRILIRSTSLSLVVEPRFGGGPYAAPTTPA